MTNLKPIDLSLPLKGRLRKLDGGQLELDSVLDATDVSGRRTAIGGVVQDPPSSSDKVARAIVPVASDGIATTQTPHIWKQLAPAIPTQVYDAYWRFAVERQAIFFRRLAGDREPWTTDPILQQYKFTNAYRASDRVSQFLIRKVIYEGSAERDEIVFRILLFKFFNKIETWELLQERLGEISYRDFCYADYDLVLSQALASGKRIYSAAYIMPAGPRLPDGTADRKHRHHLRLLEQMMSDGVPARLAALESMREAFELLRGYPSIGNFLAYQFATDINYSTVTNFSENDFVIPGPGALDGMKKCFSSLGGLNESEMITFIRDRQVSEFERLGLHFQTLFGRSLQLIDCQNLFCEIGKYSRVAHPTIQGTTGRTRIKQQFSPTSTQLTVWYPPKWGLNDRIANPATCFSSLDEKVPIADRVRGEHDHRP